MVVFPATKTLGGTVRNTIDIDEGDKGEDMRPHLQGTWKPAWLEAEVSKAIEAIGGVNCVYGDIREVEILGLLDTV